jgi:D-alanyl-D-alanine carboxypeptidase
MIQATIGRAVAVAAVFASFLAGPGETPSTTSSDPIAAPTVTPADPGAPTQPTTAPSTAPTTVPTTAPTTAPTTPPATPPTTPPATPSGTEAAGVVLTLDPPSPASQWEDRPVRLSGRLSNHASWSVSLWRHVNAGWIRIGYVRAGEGEFAVTVRPPSAATWTVKAVLGSMPTDPVQSVHRYFTVMNRSISLIQPASAYTALSGVTMTGRVTPAEAGRTVLLEYVYGGAWRGLRSGTTDANGVFRIRVPDNFPYHWTVRARTFESPSTAVEYTPAARFDVRAYLWPKVYAVTAADVSKTYRSGCPVGPSKLRRLVLTHWGFDKRLHRGELIVRDGAVSSMIAVWNAAIVNRFYVRGMRRVDVYGGSDIRSMEADNTSAFNCRQVTGDPFSLSPHSYGYAVDINTVENPYYAANGVWYPKNGLSYRDRSNVRLGMLFWGSTPTKALYQRGYFWGATWRRPDYQHFQPR